MLPGEQFRARLFALGLASGADGRLHEGAHTAPAAARRDVGQAAPTTTPENLTPTTIVSRRSSGTQRERFSDDRSSVSGASGRTQRRC